MGTFLFRVTCTDGVARCGELTTPHGRVRTPAFMPVGTRGAVKALTVRDLHDLGVEILLANTYHLFLRPGDELIARRGGIHRFIGWPGPLLTDSGGYQVFSLGAIRRVSDEGVTFRSHLDGREHLLTPERTVEIQARLGSDVAMMLDECGPYPSSTAESRTAMERTIGWAVRARRRFLELDPDLVTTPGQAQFGIVQGGVYPDLRTISVEKTLALGFDGYAIGGLSVGEPADIMYDVAEHTAALLPADRPRYLMGTGTPEDLVEAVARGIDLFDCVIPTRNARNGQLLTRFGRLNIRNSRFAEDDFPPDPECSCYTCRHFSRAYLRHLHISGEMTAATLNTLHNIHFYLDTMERIRNAIVFGSFENFRREFRRTLARRSVSS